MYASETSFLVFKNAFQFLRESLFRPPFPYNPRLHRQSDEGNPGVISGYCPRCSSQVQYIRFKLFCLCLPVQYLCIPSSLALLMPKVHPYFFFPSFTHSHQVIRNSPLSYKLCELPDL